MNIPSFNELRNIASSRYALVMLVSKRARKIVDGSEPLIDTKMEKPVSIAIEETVDGAVKFGEPMTDKEYAEKLEELIRQRQESNETVEEAGDEVEISE